MRDKWRVKVSGLKDGSNQIRFELTPEDMDIKPQHGCDLTLTRDVVAQLDLMKQGVRVYVSGKVNFEAELNCATCAEDFRREQTEPLYIEFERGTPPAAGKIHELGDDDLVRSYYTEDELNLMPVIRDTILLSIPIAPTCRPDCKGICPECGEDLNKGECACCRTEVQTASAGSR
jgi:uncharacterized protein